MSHSHKEPIICPNCGYHAVENYCARCGQETHLHNETFWGLVIHFVGHYFHYDSKFWQTLKALWFSPGKLTIAYWNKQRMRYIPPISLYIFISAVYFLAFYSFAHGSNYHYKLNTRSSGPSFRFTNYVDSLDDKLGKDTVAGTRAQSAFDAYMDRKTDKVNAEYGSLNKFFNEKILHNFPKLFFFMIPFMALILKLLFARRKNVFFVHHAIFSLHYHSFWFSAFFISAVCPARSISGWLDLALFIVAFIYMVAALRNVYNISRTRAVSYTIVITLLYFVILLITLGLVMLSVMAMA